MPTQLQSSCCQGPCGSCPKLKRRAKRHLLIYQVAGQAANKEPDMAQTMRAVEIAISPGVPDVLKIAARPVSQPGMEELVL